VSDWASETAELIGRTVGNVRDRIVEPAESIGRTIVFGTLAGLVGIAIATLGAIALFHLLVIIANEATPGPDDNAWIAWLFLGGILEVAGLFVWSKRSAKR
jgi:predicted metal-binding membrane protein